MINEKTTKTKRFKELWRINMTAKKYTKTIAIALIFAFAASMIALPSIDAAITEYETHIYVSPTPVIGVGN